MLDLKTIPSNIKIYYNHATPELIRQRFEMETILNFIGFNFSKNGTISDFIVATHNRTFICQKYIDSWYTDSFGDSFESFMLLCLNPECSHK